MNRRIFLTLSLLAVYPKAVALKKNLFLKVTFKFDLKKNLMTPKSFCELRSAYEDDYKISLLNEEYIKNGWILSHSHQGNQDHMSWDYTFKNASLFDKWERSLYSNGFVKKEGRPYDFERTYQFI